MLHEILADPGGEDINGDGSTSSLSNEFVEVVNISGKIVGLANASLQIEASTQKLIPLGYRCLAPWEARTVFGSEASLGLTNSGATVSLLIDGEVVDLKKYTDAEGNHDESITRATQLDPNSEWVRHSTISATPWSPSTCANGNAFPDCTGSGPVGDVVGDAQGDVVTPGCEGSTPLAGQLVINEIMADPGADANQDGSINNDDEFVELVNTVGFVLDVSGLTLTEGGGRTFEFPPGTCLDPYQGAVIFGRSAGLQSLSGSQVFAYDGAWGLNNGGDTVQLKDIDGDVLASVTYGSEGGKSQALTREIDLDMMSPFVLHTDAPHADETLMSPGACQSQAPFPDCGAVTPPSEDTGFEPDAARATSPHKVKDSPA